MFVAPGFMKFPGQRKLKSNRRESIRFLRVAHDCTVFLVHLAKQTKVVRTRDIKLNEEWIITQTQPTFLPSITDESNTPTLP